jgi:hypothetical protein
MELITKWKSFKTTVQNFINDANDLLYTERELLTDNDCNYLIEKVNNWINACQRYLNESFDLANNEFIIGFQAAKPFSHYLPTANNDCFNKLNGLLDELNTKKKTLIYYLELLSISDTIIQPKLVDKEIRESYTRREMIELLMDKLYHLYNNNYYPIQRIFRGNGIKAAKDTVNEIVKILEQKGFIRVISNRSLLVQLSQKGKKYIEEKRTFDLIEKQIAPAPEIQKLEPVAIEKPKETVKPETVYHHFERQMVS